MIVSKLSGGLGNQLYMYAFGRAYAEHVNKPYFVSPNAYREYGGNYDLHKYVLNRLCYPPNELTREQIESAGVNRTLMERRLRYNDQIWSTDYDNILIDLYAADYRYSRPIIGKLREELNPLVELAGEFKDWYDELRDGNTVSLHVRLQDYVTNPHCLNLPLSYYRDALRVIQDNVDKPRVYLFTDEPKRIMRERFDPGMPYTIVSHGPERNLEDLSLMCACKHHVCANSSFSFWGAWLDGSGGGLTIVPDKYHKENGNQLLETYGEIIQPEYPPDWNILKVRFPQG